jgi:hypothetical protein
MRSQFRVLKFISLVAVTQIATACSQQAIDTNPQRAANTSTQQAIAEPKPVIKADTSTTPSPQIFAGTYNVGSRYIAIANQGNRFCYEGYSMPSGRYAVAVGETTGSLTAETDAFAIDGWKKYGKTIFLRQNGNNLQVTDNSGSSYEYNLNKGNTSNAGLSEAMKKCLNSTEPFFETQPGYTISATPTAQTNGQTSEVTGNLLSAEQKAKLTQLPIPIVAPTYLPNGFSLFQALSSTAKYANGDDDSGYSIDYLGENNTCISIRNSSSGTRGLQKLREEQTEFGLLTIYTENARDNTIRNIVTPLGLKGNLILISGGTLPDSSAEGGWRPCKHVSIPTYIQVLKSLSIVK